MFLRQEDFSVRLHAVLLLNWEENVAHIDARPFRALSFRIQGDAEFILPGSRIHAGDKDILHCPEDLEYDVRAGKEQVVVVHFSTFGHTPSKFEILPVADRQRAESLFLSLLECWNGKKPGYYYRAVSTFYKILELIEKQELHSAHTAHYSVISKAVEYLQQNYRDPELTVQDLCKVSGISSTYFRKRFFEEFNMMPNKYLNTLRIEYAKELLDSGAYSVERVAEEAGFLDAKYFCTVFKRFTGTSPSEYKKGLAVLANSKR